MRYDILKITSFPYIFYGGGTPTSTPVDDIKFRLPGVTVEFVHDNEYIPLKVMHQK